MRSADYLAEGHGAGLSLPGLASERGYFMRLIASPLSARLPCPPPPLPRPTPVAQADASSIAEWQAKTRAMFETGDRDPDGRRAQRRVPKLADYLADQLKAAGFADGDIHDHALMRTAGRQDGGADRPLARPARPTARSRSC